MAYKIELLRIEFEQRNIPNGGNRLMAKATFEVEDVANATPPYEVPVWVDCATKSVDTAIKRARGQFYALTVELHQQVEVWKSDL